MGGISLPKGGKCRPSTLLATCTKNGKICGGIPAFRFYGVVFILFLFFPYWLSSHKIDPALCWRLAPIFTYSPSASTPPNFPKSFEIIASQHTTFLVFFFFFFKIELELENAINKDRFCFFL